MKGTTRSHAANSEGKKEAARSSRIGEAQIAYYRLNVLANENERLSNAVSNLILELQILREIAL